MAAPDVPLPQIERAKQISVYQNGDEKCPGKRIVINKRRIANFDVFLDHVTDTLRPRFGAVRRLYTPVGGHRVRDLEQVIQRGENFVAAGQERFHRIGYLEIEVSPRKRPNKGYLEIKPVQHSRIQTSGRIRKICTEPVIIFVHANGNIFEAPHRIQLRPREQGSWEMVLDAIKDRVSLRTGGAIRRICNLEGRPINSLHEIENSGCYVACGSERYCHMDYEHPKLVMHSPRQERRLYQHGLKLTPLSKRTSKKGSQNSSTNRTPDSHNGSMNSRPRKARRNQVKKDDPVIYEKAVAYKRNGEKKKEVNYDQDPGGVFKSHKENQVTRGAVEITEDRETRVDVPVDQRKAEVVEEESIDNTEEQEADRRTEATHPHSRKVPSPLVTPEPAATNEASETEEPVRGDNSAQRSPSPAPVEDVRMSTPEEEVNGQPVNEENEDKPSNENELASNVTEEKEDKPASEEERNREEISHAEERRKAAIAIQSGYRGYRVRRDQQKLRNSKKSTLNQDEAATVIQSRYRGYKTRHQLKHGQ